MRATIKRSNTSEEKRGRKLQQKRKEKKELNRKKKPTNMPVRKKD